MAVICGTHARVLTLTLEHLNNTIEMRQRKRGRRQAEKEWKRKEGKWARRKSVSSLIRWVLKATSGTKPIIVSAGHVYILLHQREKRGSTIQYGYRKRGTHARVFSKTLTHGNSKNDIRQ